MIAESVVFSCCSSDAVAWTCVDTAVAESSIGQASDIESVTVRCLVSSSTTLSVIARAKFSKYESNIPSRVSRITCRKVTGESVCHGSVAPDVVRSVLCSQTSCGRTNRKSLSMLVKFVSRVKRSVLDEARSSHFRRVCVMMRCVQWTGHNTAEASLRNDSMINKS